MMKAANWGKQILKVLTKDIKVFSFSISRRSSQIGTHLVVRLVDHIIGGSNPILAQNYYDGSGVTNNYGRLWEYDDLIRLKRENEPHGLTWEAIKNFDPSHRFDILLDGPKRNQHMGNLKHKISNIDKAVIPLLEHYYSILGVWSWTSKSFGE